MRDNSDATLRQFVHGIGGLDNWVRYDRNTDADTDNDCLDSDGSESYYYHMDNNGRPIMLTDSSGSVIERYEYDAYGAPRVYEGDNGSGGEAGNLRSVSTVGNPFLHQGLLYLDPMGSYQNRYRQYHPDLGRFMQRDPIGYASGINLYEPLSASPYIFRDPDGQMPLSCWACAAALVGKVGGIGAGCLWGCLESNRPPGYSLGQCFLDCLRSHDLDELVEQFENNPAEWIGAGACAKCGLSLVQPRKPKTKPDEPRIPWKPGDDDDLPGRYPNEICDQYYQNALDALGNQHWAEYGYWMLQYDLHCRDPESVPSQDPTPDPGKRVPVPSACGMNGGVILVH
jgi:RHS repeat-associated protein